MNEATPPIETLIESLPLSHLGSTCFERSPYHPRRFASPREPSLPLLLTFSCPRPCLCDASGRARLSRPPGSFTVFGVYLKRILLSMRRHGSLYNSLDFVSNALPPLPASIVRDYPRRSFPGSESPLFYPGRPPPFSPPIVLPVYQAEGIFPQRSEQNPMVSSLSLVPHAIPGKQYPLPPPTKLGTPGCRLLLFTPVFTRLFAAGILLPHPSLRSKPIPRDRASYSLP